MDELDLKILKLLAANARMSVKEIADHVSLTSPAVSSRIHKLEQSGIIGGYTVVVRRPRAPAYVDALISVSAAPAARTELTQLLSLHPEVLQCYHVTGDHSFLIKVACPDMKALEHLITEFQRFGQTNTQIILSEPVDRSGIELLLAEDSSPLPQ